MTTWEWILLGLAAFLVVTIGYGLFRFASRTGSDEEKAQLRAAAEHRRRSPEAE